MTLYHAHQQFVAIAVWPSGCRTYCPTPRTPCGPRWMSPAWSVDRWHRWSPWTRRPLSWPCRWGGRLESAPSTRGGCPWGCRWAGRRGQTSATPVPHWVRLAHRWHHAPFPWPRSPMTRGSQRTTLWTRRCRYCAVEAGAGAAAGVAARCSRWTRLREPTPPTRSWPAPCSGHRGGESQYRQRAPSGAESFCSTRSLRLCPPLQNWELECGVRKSFQQQASSPGQFLEPSRAVAGLSWS